MIARYLIPLLIVIGGIIWYTTRPEPYQYTAKTNARVFAKDCRENGRSRGGVFKYVFVLNRQAYEGQASGELCFYYAIGGAIAVTYDPDAPEKNIPIPVSAGRTGLIGIILWAVIFYFGMIVASWMIVPPPKKPWRKPIKNRKKAKP